MSSDCKLDRIDLRILSQLQKKGRITNVELADAVGLSSSPCLIRVKRLEKAGYIVGYGAQIQLEKLGDVQIVFTEVTLADHRREDFIKFVDAIRDDFHLQPTSPLRDAADPAATLATDVDGEIRPQGPGRDLGADEIK